MTEHANLVSRRLHVIGTGLVIAALVAGVLVNPWFFETISSKRRW
jgi:hypothetical protein